MSTQDFKASVFNNFIRTIDGEFRFYNLYSNKFFTTERGYESIILEMLSRPTYNKEMNETLFFFLYNNGFIVDEKVDEYVKLRFAYNELIYNSDCMHLTIVPTMSCNFNCIYCYESHEKNFMTEETEKKIQKYILRNIKKYKTLKLDWFGGEPLLCADRVLRLTAEIKSICKKNGVAFVSSITTNGYYLTEELFGELYKNGVYFYQISLDGSKDLHNTYRPNKDTSGTYDRIIDNLISISKSKNKRFQIGIRSNVTRESLSYVEELIHNISPLFSGDIRFLYTICKVSEWGGDRINVLSHNLLDDKTFEREQKRLLLLAKSFQLEIYEPSQVKLGGNICDYRKRDAFVIDCDGSLFKCTLAMQDEQNKVGYLSENGMAIFNDRMAHWMYENFDKNMCMKCDMLAYCMGSLCYYHQGNNNEAANKGICRIKQKYTMEQLLLGKKDWKSIDISELSLGGYDNGR